MSTQAFIAASPRGSSQAISPYCSGLSGLTAQRPGRSFCWTIVSTDSEIITSALPFRISSKMVTLSLKTTIFACLKLARTKRSLLPPGFLITVTLGLLMSATVWNFATFSQRVIGALPLTM